MVAPDGRVWTVGRRWVGDRPRLRNRDRDSDLDLGGDAADATSFWGDFLSFDDIGPGAILAGLAVAIAAAVLFLAVWPLVAIAIEIVILLILLVAGVVGRVLLRRPWTVEARAGNRRVRWEVPGWRASGELVEQVARRIVAGEAPHRVELGNQDQLRVR